MYTDVTASTVMRPGDTVMLKFTLDNGSEMLIPDYMIINTTLGAKAASDVVVGDYVPCADIPFVRVAAIEAV
ncbi:MAG: hypothetical protein AB7L09_00035 [Nitrospira sp.]